MLQATTGSAVRRNGRRAGKGGLTGGKILLMLSLLFGTVGSVNALMAYYAISTFRGEVNDHPYETGLAYNTQIAAAHAQEARNWRVDIRFVPAAMGKQLEVSARDADGRPIAGLRMTGLFASPVDMALDHPVKMTEQQVGVYDAPIPVTGGYWDLKIAARRDREVLFQSKSRVHLE
jgi:nitrogen fixation protein FixH